MSLMFSSCRSSSLIIGGAGGFEIVGLTRCITSTGRGAKTLAIVASNSAKMLFGSGAEPKEAEQKNGVVII